MTPRALAACRVAFVRSETNRAILSDNGENADLSASKVESDFVPNKRDRTGNLQDVFPPPLRNDKKAANESLWLTMRLRP